MWSDREREVMRLAIAEAEKGRTSPNPRVGAAIVRDGRVIATGHHRKAGAAHAEVDAIARATGPLDRATLYVTLEPCNHQGRTGPCTEAIIEAGIGRVVIGCRDPKPHVPGAIDRLEGSGIEVQIGLLEDECTELIADFTKHIETDSLRDTFGDLADDIETGYDIAVRSEVPFGERITAAPVPIEIAETVAGIDGVETVQPRVIEFGVIPNKADGEAATSNGGPNIGVNWEDQSSAPRLFIADGRPPAGPGEFTVDLDTAADDAFIVGETYGVQTPAGLVEAELVGTFSFASPDENALVGAKLVAFDTQTSVELLNGGRGYDDITVTLDDDADEAAVIAAAEAVVGDDLEVVTREVLVEEQSENFNEFIDIFRTILLVFAFIILLVAAFIIYNVFSIIVGQRIQEIGLLRALGATGRQITRSIAVEAFGVGLFATAVGLAVGVPLAAGFQALLASAEFGPEEGGTPLRLTTIIVAIVLGVGLTLVAAVWPALRARSISPMAAHCGPTCRWTGPSGPTRRWASSSP